MKILITGAGNMGKTYLHGFLSSRFIDAGNIYILSRTENSATGIEKIQPSNIQLQAGEYISHVDIIILAVKPQDFETLASQIKPFVHREQLVLSIMAGITTDTIASFLNTPKVVRAMPNLPSQTGMGMTVFTATPDVDRKELFIIQNLINTTGKSVYVEEENMPDAATAVSGSSPAYVYFFMQAMIDAAQEMGFTPAQAELLVNQTFMGAVLLHNQSNLSCEEWVKKVASKGGTTEAALEIMEQHHVKNNIEKALFAALERCRELGK